MLTIQIKGTEYNLATTLRVAYEVQGQHNHKPYADIFKGIADMVVEDQIAIIYAAFRCANPVASQGITRQIFQEYCLDNFNLKNLMTQLQAVIKGIMGEDDDEVSNGATSVQGEAPEGN